MKNGFVLLVLLSMWSAACTPALKDLKPALSASDSGGIWFATAGSLVRSADQSRLVPGGPVLLSGDLAFPSGTGPFPAVVLAHGCGGVGNAESGWAPVLREWGYATFIIDSFRGRSLSEVCTRASTLTGTQRIPDAYGALRILATHARIDARHVALMGFSHGGILTLEASTTWAKDTFAPAGQPAFSAFLPFYPYCNTMYPERRRISAPLRIHIGELDDWTPAASCVRLTELLKAAGQDAAITVYPRAHHSFDNLGRAYMHLATVDSGAGCAFALDSILGPFPPASAVAGCLRKGGTIAWSPEATESARRNVRAQLTELLR
jgi:dienelactone hydrolase